MPRAYVPKLYDKDFHDSYREYLDYIRKDLVDPHEVCMSFCGEWVEVREEETPRIHVVELYREFVLWSDNYPKLNYRISTKLFRRFASGYFGRSRQTYYSLGYYPHILVPEPVSQSLIKLYDKESLVEDLCTVCSTPLDFLNTGEEMECLICMIADSKAKWGAYHAAKTKSVRSHQKAIQAPKD